MEIEKCLNSIYNKRHFTYDTFVIIHLATYVQAESNVKETDLIVTIGTSLKGICLIDKYCGIELGAFGVDQQIQVLKSIILNK